MKTIQVKLIISEQFHEFIDATAKLKGISVEEYIIDELIDSLDCALQDSMGRVAGMSTEVCHDYNEQVRDLVYPEEDRQEEVQIGFPPDLINEIEKIAKAEHRSFGQMLNHFVDLGIKEMEAEQEART